MTYTYVIITNTVKFHLKYILFNFAMMVPSGYWLDYEAEDGFQISVTVIYVFFTEPSRPAPRPTQPRIQGVTGSFYEEKVVWFWSLAITPF
jgi:hypothetical protein